MRKKYTLHPDLYYILVVVVYTVQTISYILYTAVYYSSCSGCTCWATILSVADLSKHSSSLSAISADFSDGSFLLKYFGSFGERGCFVSFIYTRYVTRVMSCNRNKLDNNIPALMWSCLSTEKQANEELSFHKTQILILRNNDFFVYCLCFWIITAFKIKNNHEI